MRVKRVAMRSGGSRGTKTPGDIIPYNENVTKKKRDWKRGDLCLARVIGNERQISLVTARHGAHLTLYTLHVAKHSATGDDIWTLADTMEPRRSQVEDCIEIDAASIPSADRIAHLLDVTDLWRVAY